MRTPNKWKKIEYHIFSADKRLNINVAGHVFCDTAHTANLISAESSDTNAVYTGSQSVDNNLYYNNYANDPYNNGYYDYSNDPTLFAPQAPVEADR